MKTRTYTKLMAAAVLASSLLLGACGKKEENTTSASSSKTVQISSSSKAASSSKVSSAPKISSSVSSAGAVGQSGQAENPASQEQPAVEVSQPQQVQPQQASGRQSTQTQPAQAPENNRQFQNKQAESNARYKGVLTMVDGDFSAAAGTWKDANGNTVTVSGNGQFTVQSADGKTGNYSIASYSYTLDDGKYNAQLSGQDSASLQIITGADGSVTSVVVSQR